MKWIVHNLIINLHFVLWNGLILVWIRTLIWGWSETRTYNLRVIEYHGQVRLLRLPLPLLLLCSHVWKWIVSSRPLIVRLDGLGITAGSDPLTSAALSSLTTNTVILLYNEEFIVFVGGEVGELGLLLLLVLSGFNGKRGGRQLFMGIGYGSAFGVSC